MTDEHVSDPVEVVRKALKLRSRKALDAIWAEYPDDNLWKELIGALSGAKKANIAFVRAVLKDRKRRRDRFKDEFDIINSRSGECSGCGVLNCRGRSWDRCPLNPRKGDAP